MYYLSLGAIFANENSWITEWIQYHQALGVEHFFLFNHDKDSRVSDRILQPYVEQGIVDNIHIFQSSQFENINETDIQNFAYLELIKNVRNKTHWLGLIDLDEFIYPKVCNNICDLMEKYEQFSGLAINWRIYGTSGYIKRPPTQVNHLLYRADEQWRHHRFVKSIIRPDDVDFSGQYYVHTFPTKTNVIVNENYEVVNEMDHAISMKNVCLNHYVLRSWQDFCEVKSKRVRFNRTPECDQNYFVAFEKNDVFDNDVSQRFGHLIQ